MKTLTVFDLDETLVSGDSSVEWRRFLQDRGIITDPDYTKKDNEMMRQYAAGTLDIYDSLVFSMSPIRGIPTAEVDALVRECVNERVLHRAFPEGQAIIQSLIAENPDDVLLISATVSFIVKPIATFFGLKHALGVDLDTTNGDYSSTVVGTPSFQNGKVIRLKQWLAEQDKADNHYDRVVFYTDSINDLPLCEFADEVFTVNPCPKLKPIAEARGWTVLNWVLPRAIRA